MLFLDKLAHHPALQVEIKFEQFLNASLTWGFWLAGLRLESHQVGMGMPFVRSKVAKLDIALAPSFLRNFGREKRREKMQW